MPVVSTLEEPRRPAAGLALFSYGFRPFFLLAALQGALAVALWVPAFLGMLPLPPAVELPIWHAHEMIFGFAVAGMAGFFLTAVPNWTGAPALHGWPLAALAALWLAGRIAMSATAVVPTGVAAVVDLAFLPALGAAIAVPLVRAGARRNLVLLVVLAALWLSDLAMQAEFLGWTEDSAARGARVGIDILLLLITVIGGRIVPAFTGNALRAAGSTALPRSFPWLDRAAIAAMVLLALSEAVTGLGEITGTVALAAAGLNAIRLGFWRGERTLGSPILWALHLGYLWLVLGLALKGLAGVSDLVPEAAALHALTAGAIATMLVAVMSRASLGHTGRALRAPPAVVAAYGLISVAAALRAAAQMLPDHFIGLLIAAGAAWTLAFVVFLGVYAPILAGPRADGAAG